MGKMESELRRRFLALHETENKKHYMKIEPNRVVSLCYTLKINGTIADKAAKENPMKFLFGSGELLPEFENNIEGMQPGDDFDFVIEAEKGYGKYDEEAIAELEKDLFSQDGEFADDVVKIGERIRMQDGDNILYGTVVSISESTVKMNFNHPLAGCDLHFTGTILGVREAGPEDSVGCSDCSGCCCNDYGCGC